MKLAMEIIIKSLFHIPKGNKRGNILLEKEREKREKEKETEG